MRRALLLTALLWAVACSTSRSRFILLGPPEPPRPADCEVHVFLTGTPEREFVRVSRIDVHIERTLFSQARLDEALPELRRQACLSGADGVIEIQERQESVVFETRSYHVIAVGVRYRDW